MTLDSTTDATQPSGTVGLRRALGLWSLVIIGMVMVQPTAPMGIYGVISNKAHGHVVTTILIAMVAMLFTAISYGRMARVYPSSGSAYTYVSREFHPTLGYIVGWSMVMDYVLGPLICVAFCAKAAMNIVPGLSFYVWILLFALLFTWLNLRGIKTSARLNEALCLGMVVVVVLFLASVVRTVWHFHADPAFFVHPFYTPAEFKWPDIFTGTSVAVLTYIGFDAVSTLSEEVENPRRNILLATVLVCLITGLLSALEVYAAQLVWGSKPFPSDQVESAFALVSRQVGGAILFQVVNFTLLIANLGSGMGSQLAAGRLLYGMGRGNALPRSFSEPSNLFAVFHETILFWSEPWLSSEQAHSNCCQAGSVEAHMRLARRLSTLAHSSDSWASTRLRLSIFGGVRRFASLKHSPSLPWDFLCADSSGFISAGLLLCSVPHGCWWGLSMERGGRTDFETSR